MASREEIPEIEDVSERLLHSAARLLLDDSRDMIETGLRPENVAELAERSRRAFYARFESKSALLDEALDSFLDPGRNTSIDDLVDLIDAVVESQDGEVVGSVYAAAMAHWDEVANADLQPLQMIAWALAAGDARAEERLRKLYDSYDERLVAVFDRLFGHWGRQLRHPFTPTDVSVVLTALLDGLLIRRRFEPEVVPDSLFGDTIVALIPGLTQLDGPIEPISDQLIEISAAASAQWRERSDDRVLRDTRRAVLDTTIEALESRGYANTTLDHILLRSLVSPQALAADFASLHHICCTAAAGYRGSFAAAIEQDLVDLALPRDEVVALAAERLVIFASSHRGLTQALVSAAMAYADESHYEPAPNDVFEGFAEPLSRAMSWAANDSDGQTVGNVRETAKSLVELVFFRAGAAAKPDPDQLLTMACAHLGCPLPRHFQGDAERSSYEEDTEVIIDLS